MRKLTESQKVVLTLVADGGFLSFEHLVALHNLEKKGYVEQVKTGFVSQTFLRITPAGRLALKGGEDGR